MSSGMSSLTCAFCGHTFDPANQASCQGCPLQPGCSLVRCPVCGFETVNPAQSSLARLFSRVFTRRNRAVAHQAGQSLATHLIESPKQGELTLADIPPGAQVAVVHLLEGLSDERQAHLRAYGLAPGSRVLVKQHHPVTVIQVDHTELALERSLAQKVSVRRFP